MKKYPMRSRVSDEKSLSYLGDEDEEEEEAVGVHHALALLRGAAAAEERDQENNGPYKMLLVCGFRLYRNIIPKMMMKIGVFT